MGNLQAALDLAKASGEPVWVAAGLYRQTSLLENEVADTAVTVLGGFPAEGTPGLTQRDWRRFRTVLSGDPNGDDADNDGGLSGSEPQ